MPLSVEQKQDIIKEYGRGTADTGSPEVQVALLSARISELTEHFGTATRRTTTHVVASSSWSTSGASSLIT
jgi:ribosomal protein S15